MQIQRLFEIVYILLDQKTTTSKQLAQHFEVSVRTILRDIDTLTTAGIPIYTTQGKGGGISILDRYVLNKTLLSEAEQNQILFALQSLRPFGPEDDTGITQKLRSLFSKADTDWMEVDLTRWGASTSDREKFTLLRQALLERRALQCDYSGGDGQTRQREMYPLKLLYKGKAWYLQAFCLSRQAQRLFKVNRMQNLSLLDDRFDPAAYVAPTPENPGPPPESLCRVKLLFHPSMAYRVYDEFDPRCVAKQPDGSLLVEVVMPFDNWLPPFLLSFGTGVEALEPPALRQELAREAKMICLRYSNKT